MLAVGDVEAIRTHHELQQVHTPERFRRMGDFHHVLSGRLRLPAPLYFIGGNHEPWEALDKLGGGSWGPEVYYLGRQGVASLCGLRVAFLSGIYRSEVTEGPLTARSASRKARSYWHRSEWTALQARARAEPLDLLLTHDWPRELATAYGYQCAGDANVSELLRRLQPKLHFCGHMHRSFARPDLGVTIALNEVRAGLEAVALVEWRDSGAFQVLR